MIQNNSVIAVFPDHKTAEAAVRKLAEAGIPKDSVVTYETALKADTFLILARGPTKDVQRAKSLLENFKPDRLDTHDYAENGSPALKIS